METIKSNIKAKSIICFNAAGKKTLINSLSPNFSYINKLGDIVNPQQCCVY